MARTFKHRNTTFADGARLSETDCRIEFNSSEQSNTLDLAVFVTDVSFFNGNGRIFVVVNEVNPETFDIKIELTKIVASSNTQAIYQGSLPLNEFKLKDNLIDLKTEASPPDIPPPPSGPPPVILRLATITGFIEDINLSVTLGRTEFDTTS